METEPGIIEMMVETGKVVVILLAIVFFINVLL